VKIVHICPACFNALEVRLTNREFPDAVVMSPVTEPVAEFAKDEIAAGQTIEAKLLRFDEFDVVIQTSGSLLSTWQLAFNPVVKRIFEHCYNNGGIIAAICVGTMTIAKLDIPLKGVRVTCFPLTDIVAEFMFRGAIVLKESAVSDKRIVTARDQIATPKWLRLIKQEIARL